MYAVWKRSGRKGAMNSVQHTQERKDPHSHCQVSRSSMGMDLYTQEGNLDTQL